MKQPEPFLDMEAVAPNQYSGDEDTKSEDFEERAGPLQADTLKFLSTLGYPGTLLPRSCMQSLTSHDCASFSILKKSQCM